MFSNNRVFRRKKSKVVIISNYFFGTPTLYVFWFRMVWLRIIIINIIIIVYNNYNNNYNNKYNYYIKMDFLTVIIFLCNYSLQILNTFLIVMIIFANFTHYIFLKCVDCSLILILIF